MLNVHGQSASHRNELTAEEKRVLINKGTERPFIGKYTDNKEKGTYTCKWCDAPAIFAGGCFWGVQHFFDKAPGVLKSEVGYTGGTKANPTYKEVCAHTTGHVEAIKVTYDPQKTSYEAMAKLFFEIHDPTQTNGQGPDLGPQYLSEVFYADENQKATAEKLIGLLKQKGYKVVTRVRPAVTFWPAEEYHQEYYEKTGGTPYCHMYTKRF